jgi:hypothetical protein
MYSFSGQLLASFTSLNHLANVSYLPSRNPSQSFLPHYWTSKILPDYSVANYCTRNLYCGKIVTPGKVKLPDTRETCGHVYGTKVFAAVKSQISDYGNTVRYGKVGNGR